MTNKNKYSSHTVKRISQRYNEEEFEIIRKLVNHYHLEYMPLAQSIKHLQKLMYDDIKSNEKKQEKKFNALAKQIDLLMIINSNLMQAMQAEPLESIKKLSIIDEAQVIRERDIKTNISHNRYHL